MDIQVQMTNDVKISKADGLLNYRGCFSGRQ